MPTYTTLSDRQNGGLKGMARKLITEKAEIERLTQLYQDIPENKKELVEGLIAQAARLRVSLDKLWRDIRKNGETEVFKQGNDAFKRERPESKIFTARDKNYQAIIKQLDALLPTQSAKTGFLKLDEDEDEVDNG